MSEWFGGVRYPATLDALSTYVPLGMAEAALATPDVQARSRAVLDVMDRLMSTMLAAGEVAFATVAAYLVWVGWDQHNDEAPDGSLSGPYEAWQVVGLVLTLSVIAGASGWKQRPLTAIVVMPLALTLCFAVDAVTDPPEQNDGLWVIGAAMVFVGALFGTAFVAAVAAALARDRANATSGPAKTPA